MSNFVNTSSIVREIWGKSDTVLFIFAGSAAEFALNEAVDWLYYTGRLPADPLGRLFSTVSYAREIIFSSTEKANAAIDKMRSIHTAVENARGAVIPDSAYRDVLFMLIHYSIASFETLERRLTGEEKEEVAEVFLRVGNRMKIPGLPCDFVTWSEMYHQHTLNHLRRSVFTADLFLQYKKHLGPLRFLIMKETQKILVTKHVRKLLNFNPPVFIRPVLAFYKFSRMIKVHHFIKAALLPPLYKQRIRMLDIHT